jgi:hypothetical protein
MKLDLAAERAPREVSFEEVVERSGIDALKVRGQLGALSTLTRRLFGQKIWPVVFRFSEGGQAHYSMDPQIATWWERDS